MGAAFSMGAMFCFSIVREPVIKQERPTVTLRETFLMARRILAEDSVYRRYLAVRCLIGLAAISSPFFILHATGTLGLGLGSAGLLIVVMKLGGMSTYLFWGKAGDAKGTRIVLFAGTILLVIIPLSALASNFWTPLPAAMLTFAIMGLANAGIHIGVTNYLLDHSEPSERPVYVAMTQVIIGIVAIVPLLGGIIAEIYGYNLLFVISLSIAILAVVLAFMLPEPRHLAEKRFRSMVRLA
jgi:MFS family permease